MNYCLENLGTQKSYLKQLENHDVIGAFKFDNDSLEIMINKIQGTLTRLASAERQLEAPPSSA